LPPQQETAFFSYSRDDSEFVLRLAEDLKAAGADVWLDQLDITPGQRWARAIQEALQSSPRVLVVLSPASVSSTHVEDEVNFAIEERKTVIPVFYRDCKVPFQLRPLQYIDFRNDYALGLRVMLKTLCVKPQSVANPAAAATSPRSSPVTATDAEAQLEQERESKAPAEQPRSTLRSTEDLRPSTWYNEQAIERIFTDWTTFPGNPFLIIEPGVKFDSLPFVPAPLVTLSSSTFRTMVNRTIIALAPEKKGEFRFDCALFSLKGRTITLVATDGHRLAIIEYAVEAEGPRDEVTVLVPKSAMGALQKFLALLDSDERHRLGFSSDGTYQFFSLENYALICRTPNGEFPNYRAVLPHENHLRTEVDSAELAGALQRAGLLADPNSRCVTIQLKPGRVELFGVPTSS